MSHTKGSTLSSLKAIVSLNGAPRFREVETIVTLRSLILTANEQAPMPKSRTIRSLPRLIASTSQIKKSIGSDELTTHFSFSFSISIYDMIPNGQLYTFLILDKETIEVGNKKGMIWLSVGTVSRCLLWRHGSQNWFDENSILGACI
ncbi:unnamed protein product [Linum trigynum]|uniref:Uncharacterized protein n=1 Tax=Linum trigynum TaxID=586398 RepID=A0AAV2F6N1_9ROSI